jgi:hypothetical protein
MSEINYQCPICKETKGSEGMARHCVKNHEYHFYSKIVEIEKLGIPIKIEERESYNATTIIIGNLTRMLFEYGSPLKDMLYGTSYLSGYLDAVEYLKTSSASAADVSPKKQGDPK